MFLFYLFFIYYFLVFQKAMLKKKFKKTVIMPCKNHPEAEAEWYCKGCRMYMCQTCKTAHDTLFGSNENHSVISVASLTPFDLFDGKCVEHNRDLDFICNGCNSNHSTYSIIIIIIYVLFFILILKNFAALCARKLGNIKNTTQSLYRNQRMLSEKDL